MKKYTISVMRPTANVREIEVERIAVMAHGVIGNQGAAVLTGMSASGARRIDAFLAQNPQQDGWGSPAIDNARHASYGGHT